MKVNDHRKTIFLLVWICSSFIIAVFIFTNGLLLHREELPYRSTCHNESTKLETDRGFIHEQHCSSSDLKVILIIIDALRYDFVEHVDIPEDQELPYQNKLSVINDILETNPKNSKLFKFIADPPTTTMQRIKALTTGCLSTFIDISSNFASTEIKEDNLIDIGVRENINIVNMGDDTWSKLYPNRFIRSYPFDSFNVWDLDTVDNGVKQNLFPELEKSDWNLLIGHFLGVDHCGHRYGPVHSEMSRKLNEMNDVLKKIIKRIQQENILLFVIGDHGMTSTGDHGGDTEKEVTSAIFVYSPIHPLFSIPNRTFESINQVDIVPTLSTILGLPIPFSNTGSVILECVPNLLLNSIDKISAILWKNIEQITNYIKMYSQHNSQFTSNQLESILNHYTRLKKEWPNKDVRTMIDDFQSYTAIILETCQQVWVKFSEPSIIFGLICVLLISVFTYFTSELKTIDLSLINGYFLVLFFIIFSLFTVISILLAEFFSIDLVTSVYFSTEIFSISTMFWFCTNLNISIESMTRKIRCEIVDIFCISFYIIILIIPFSNSFVLEEPKIVLYLFVTLLWVITYSNLPKISSVQGFLTSDHIKNAIFSCFIYRVTLSYAKCRGEEDYQCQIAEPAKISLVSCLVAIFSFTCSIISGNFRNWISLVTCFFISLYWICETLVVNVEKDIAFVNNIPGFLLISLTTLLCIIFYDPLLRIFPNNESSLSSQNIKNPSNLLENSFINIFTLLSCICVAILGQLYAVPAVLMSMAVWFLAYSISSYKNDQKPEYEFNVPWSTVMLWSLSSIYWFYTTGHNTSFSSIQWNAAFLIQKEIKSGTLIPGILVVMHTFMSQAIHSVLLMLLAVFPYLEYGRKKLKFNVFHRTAFTLVLKYLILYSIRIFFTMLAAYLHRRHLMMWSVFAPKFIFEGISFICIEIPFSLLGYLFALRVARRLRT